jgi:RDD family
MEPSNTQASTRRYVARRLLAIAIDGLVFLGPWLLSENLAEHWQGGLTTGEIDNLLKDLSFHTVFLLYFLLCEAWRGCTVGKWLMGLRVRNSGRHLPGSFIRVLVRTAVFSGTLFYLPTLVEFSTESDLAYLLASIIAIAILLAPARPGNGCRGLHEWASGTEVVSMWNPSKESE